MKKYFTLLAFVVAAILVFSIIAQGGFIKVEENETDDLPRAPGPVYYNRTAARGYAYRWWDTRNPHYNDFSSSGGDCANFVSQCLIAGGLSLHNGTDGDGYGVYPDVDRPSVYSNGTIPYCDYMHTHFVNYQPTDYQQITSSDPIPSWIEVGDPVIFGSTSDNWEHAMVVVWKGESDLGLAGHTSDKWNFSFNEELSYFDLANMYHIQSHGYQGDEFLFEVNTSSLNVRVGPGIKDTGDYYQDIGDIHSGEKYVAIETALDDSGNTWYHFWFDDRAAWCAADFGSSHYAVPSAGQTYLEIDVGYYLNVRNGPGTSYEDVGEVYSGMRFFPIDNSSGWYKFYWGGQEVWASGSYMTLYNYSGPSRVDGIDVSHWQGDIDWNQVYGDGYRFAFCKASGGVSVVDSEFEDNMQNGTAAGVYMGPYHFAHPESNTALDEVDHFLNVAGDYITDGYLRPVLDLESGDGDLTWEELSAWADTWMSEVEARTGVEPLIYTGWYRDYLEPYMANYDLWVAYWTYDSSGEPETGIWDDWTVWQYSDEGSVSGISGNVDLDVYDGNMDQLENELLINTSSQSDPNPLAGKIIAIDPGHGGSDVGAEGIDGASFPNEEDFNLDIGLRLKKLLVSAGATVIMTRETDTDVTLQERCDIANNNNSDIFVSIHMNSATESAHGTETFYWAEDDVTYSVDGKRLAQHVQNRTTEYLGTYDRGARGDKPYFGYHLYVLDNTNMPAVLNEMCFISNQSDFDMISQEDNRTKGAFSLYHGICDYFDVSPSVGEVSQSGYPSSNSRVARTVFFDKEWTNESFFTRSYWSVDGVNQGDLFHREWFFDAQPSMQQPILNTSEYQIGWHDVKIVTKNLWMVDEQHNFTYRFERSPIAQGTSYGTPSAYNISDDNDTTYGANDLGEPLYVDLPCNLTIDAFKTHLWDGDDRFYQYKIEISQDKKSWTEVVNKTSGEYRSWQWDYINSHRARYVRFTGTNNSANQWYHINEFKIFVEETHVFYGDAAVDGIGYWGNVTVTNTADSSTITTDVENGSLWIDLTSMGYTEGDNLEVTFDDPAVSGSLSVTGTYDFIPEEINLIGDTFDQRHISLGSGWQFISHGLILLDDSIENILSDVDYDKVMYYDSYNDGWRTYNTDRADHYNSLFNWNRSVGIWIHVTGDSSLHLYSDISYTYTDIVLRPGWNMVGYPHNISQSADLILPLEVTKFGVFDSGQQYNIKYDVPANVTLEPGKAYWLYNSADHSVTWTINR